MYLEDRFDEPLARKQLMRRPAFHKARYLVYSQLIAVIPGILIGRSETGGYGQILVILAPVAVALYFSIFIFPIVVFVRLMRESPQETGAFAALPLSLALSFVQFLALLPLFQ